MTAGPVEEVSRALAQSARRFLDAELRARLSLGIDCRLQFQGADERTCSRWAIVDASGGELVAIWIEFHGSEVHLVCEGGIT